MHRPVGNEFPTMPILACRGKSQRIARVMAALALASFTAQSLPGAKQSKIGATASGSWAQDKNGNNAWDGTVTDGLYAWGTGADGEIFVYGDWNGDGRTKMGVYLNGTWVLDYNGNGILDDPSVDKVVAFGDSNYKPIVGDWNGDGRTKIGVYNSATGTFLLDYNGNYAWDGTTEDRNITWTSVPNTNEKPVIGDWNGDGRAKIGIYTTAGTWILDYNGNYAWDGTGTDKVVSWSTYASSGELPVVGDWNGDGRTKIGVYQDGTWIADYNGNYVWDGTSVDKLAFYGGPGYDPVVGDWNIDGKAKIAIYQTSSGNWTIDMNGNWVLDQYGNGDVFTNFGGSTFKPVVGAWIKTNGILISPAQSSTLSGSSVVFAWGGGVGVTAYTLDVGTYNGGGDIFSQNVGVVTGRQVNNIPMNGAIVYVKLGSQIDGSWTYDTRTFTAFPAAKASIVDPYPNPGAHLNAATVAFSWSGGNGVSEYSFDWAAGYIYDTDPATSVGLVTSTTANGIPVGYGNTTIYVRLGSRIGGAWQFNRYTYLQATTTSKAVMLSPIPQSTLGGSQVTFAWSVATNAASYQLQVGTTGFNSPNIYNGVVSGTSKTISGIPTSGSTPIIYVRLSSLGTGDILDTTYVPLNQGLKAEIISPAPSSNPATPTVLGGPTVTFSWTPGIGVIGYRLQVGNAAGSGLIADQVVGRGTSPTITGLPTDGSLLNVRLISDLGSSQLTADYTFQAAADRSRSLQKSAEYCNSTTCYYYTAKIERPDPSGTSLYASINPYVSAGSSAGVKLFFRAKLYLGTSTTAVATTGDTFIECPPDKSSNFYIYIPGPGPANTIDAATIGFGKYTLKFDSYGTVNGVEKPESEVTGHEAASLEVVPAIKLMWGTRELGLYGTNVIVGQKFALNAVRSGDGGAQPTSQHWFFSDSEPKPINDYSWAPDGSSATITRWQDSASDHQTMFWTQSGGSYIRYTATYANGYTAFVSTTVTISKPTVTQLLPSFIPEPAVQFAHFNPPDIWVLSLGTKGASETLDDGGFKILVNTDVLPGQEGDLAFVQLVKGYANISPASGGVFIGTDTGGQYLLDGSAPYDGETHVTAGSNRSAATGDMPSAGIKVDDIRAEMNLDFKTYVIYRPVGDGNIWVPLGEADWGFRAVVARPPAWAKDTFAEPTVLRGPTLFNSSTPPEWSGKAVINQRN